MWKVLSLIFCLLFLISDAFGVDATNYSSLHTSTCYYQVIDMGNKSVVKSCSNGAQKYSSSDDDAVIQWAWDNVPNTTVSVSTYTTYTKQAAGKAYKVFRFFLPGVVPGTVKIKHTSTAGGCAACTSDFDVDGGNGTGTIAGTNIATGTIDYRIGEVYLLFTAAPDASTNIQAIHNHTRNRKYKIVGVGDFEISTALTIPSFLIWELDGSITAAAGYSSSTDLIINDDTTNGNGYIEIVGGTYDGSSLCRDGIRMTNANDVIVRDATIRNVQSWGVNVGTSLHSKIINNTIINAGDDGIAAEDATNGIIALNTIYGAKVGYSATATGIEIEGNTQNYVIGLNYIENMGSENGMGMNITKNSGGTTQPSNIVAIGNITQNMMLNGINVSGISAANPITKISLIGNVNNTTIETDGSVDSSNGINMLYGYANTIIGNISTAANDTGFYAGNSQYNSFVGNVADRNVEEGFYLSTSNYNLLVGNIGTSNDSGEGTGNAGLTLANGDYNMIIANNYSDYLASPTQNWGISNQATANYNRIAFNQLWLNTSNPVTGSDEDEIYFQNLNYNVMGTATANVPARYTMDYEFTFLAKNDTDNDCDIGLSGVGDCFILPDVTTHGEVSCFVFGSEKVHCTYVYDENGVAIEVIDHDIDAGTADCGATYGTDTGLVFTAIGNRLNVGNEMGQDETVTCIVKGD